ncbi:hypothetical protein [Marinobacter sp.]|uniref:hypothetical protein n=1 Tax=Marinobacter sp. TaxID=50741 RepID=UPI003A8CA344
MASAQLCCSGDSSKPDSDPEHQTYSKRQMASDMDSVMKAFGHQGSSVAGHHRGARVIHRLCLDPDYYLREKLRRFFLTR